MSEHFLNSGLGYNVCQCCGCLFCPVSKRNVKMVFCSHGCRYRARHLRRREDIDYIEAHKKWSSIYYAKNRERYLKYLSDKRAQNRKPKPKTFCQFCGSEKVGAFSKLRHCSPACARAGGIAKRTTWTAHLAKELDIETKYAQSLIRESGCDNAFDFCLWNIQRMGKHASRPIGTREHTTPAYHRAWRLKNRERLLKRRRAADKLKFNDPDRRLARSLRSRFSKAWKSKKLQSSRVVLSLVGCSIPFLRQHLEAQFEPWMKWENYGKEWHVDHIEPLSAFRLSHPIQAKIAWHYTNLRPLRKFDNLSKGAKYKPFTYSLVPLLESPQ